MHQLERIEVLMNEIEHESRESRGVTAGEGSVNPQVLFTISSQCQPPHHGVTRGIAGLPATECQQSIDKYRCYSPVHNLLLRNTPEKQSEPVDRTPIPPYTDNGLFDTRASAHSMDAEVIP